MTALSSSILPIFNSLTAQRSHAYAKIAIVDSAGNILNEQYALVQANANQWNPIALSFTVPHTLTQKELYAVAFVGNESQMDVFFDNVLVEHERLAWQENHYYAFGLSMKPLDREGAPDHRWKYNAMTERESSFGLDWDETFYRTYDEQLGRFLQVDPKADEAEQEVLKPYHYSLNNPVRFNDPKGLWPWESNRVKDARRDYRNAPKGTSAATHLKARIGEIRRLERSAKKNGTTLEKAYENNDMDNDTRRSKMITNLKKADVTEVAEKTRPYLQETPPQRLNTTNAQAVSGTTAIPSDVTGVSVTIGVNTADGQTVQVWGATSDNNDIPIITIPAATNTNVSVTQSVPSNTPITGVYVVVAGQAKAKNNFTQFTLTIRGTRPVDPNNPPPTRKRGNNTR